MDRKPTTKEVDYIISTMDKGIAQYNRHDGTLIGATVGNGKLSIALFDKDMYRKGTWTFNLK